MFCHNCGNSLPEGTKFCQKCGAKVVFEESVQQSPEESVVADGAVDKKGCSSHQSSFVDNQSFQTADDSKSPKKPYGESIKPYYREQFDRIASGQKPKFNWAALFLNGWMQLYNGCTGIFCKTFLPVFIALFMVSLIGMVGVSRFNVAAVVAAAVLGVVTGLASAVLSIVNGFRFNKWYYQDVINNQGKKRSRKGFWILLVSGIGVMILAVAVPQYLRARHYDVSVDEWPYDGVYDKQAEDDDVSLTESKDGYSILATTPPSDGMAEDAIYAEEQETAEQRLLEWFEGHPLKHDIRIRFMDEALDGTNDGSRYLKYELDMEYQRYGIFYVNPDNGDMAMDSILNSYGSLVPIQTSMD